VLRRRAWRRRRATASSRNCSIAKAANRGGGRIPVSWNAQVGEDRYRCEPPDDLSRRRYTSSDELFARAILVPVPSVLTARQEKSAAKIIREAVG